MVWYPGSVLFLASGYFFLWSFMLRGLALDLYLLLLAIRVGMCLVCFGFIAFLIIRDLEPGAASKFW